MEQQLKNVEKEKKTSRKARTAAHLQQ